MMQRFSQPRFIINTDMQFSRTDIKYDFLWVLILCCSCIVHMCQGVVLFVSQPHNQTVKEGETAHFECIYQGSDLTPAWRINNTIYSHTQLPTKFLFNDQDFSLTINSVPESLNFTSFQCSVGTIFSTRGYLFVEVEIQNVSTTRSTSNSRLIQTTPDFVMTDSSVNATLSSTVNSNNESQVIVPVLISVGVLVSIVLSCIGLFGTIVTILLWTKKAKVSESIQQDIDVLGENEAYAAMDKYRKHIKTDINPAYETTLSFVSDHSWRCNSPQA